jgi:alpha-glucosidase (family GH31 glycosyl hydrolase)
MGPCAFPDPKDFLTELHKEGLKVTLNLHPASGVQPWEDAYPQFAHNMGIDPATQKYVPFDLTDRQFAKNYLDLLHHPLEAQGVDFWWLDWQQENNTQASRRQSDLVAQLHSLHRPRARGQTPASLSSLGRPR